MLLDSLTLLKRDSSAKISELSLLYQNAIRDLSELERLKYDTESRLETALSDSLILTQDLTIKSREVDVLHTALVSTEKEKALVMKKMEEGYQEKVKKIEGDWGDRLDKEKERYLREKVELEKRLVDATSRIEEEILTRRKMQMEMTAEKKKMHSTLQSALNKLQNSQADSVDRTLVKNLIITYFQQKR
jgi:ATP-dependent Lon protease